MPPRPKCQQNPEVKHFVSELPNVVNGVSRGTLPVYTQNKFEGLEGFDLKKARIWPGLFFLCHIRSTGDNRQRSGLKFARHRYEATSLIRNRHPVGPYRKTMPRALWWF